MEPTLSFSDNSVSDFDREAEVRLQHMFEVVHASPVFKTSTGSNGSWENDTVHIDVSSVAAEGVSRSRFSVRRNGSVGRSVEAIVTTTTDPTTGEQHAQYAVCRTEDGWTVQYALGQAEQESRAVRAWQADPTAASDTAVPSTQFHMRANTILTDLESGISRFSISQQTTPS